MEPDPIPWTNDELFTACCGIISFLSVAGGLSMVISANHFNHEDIIFLVNIVKWMGIFGAIQSICVAYSMFALSFRLHFPLFSELPESICSIKGFIEQFATVGNATLVFLLTMILFSVMYFGVSLNKVNNSTKAIKIIVLLVSFADSIMLLFNNAYGNNTTYVCGVRESTPNEYNNEFYSLLPIMIYVLFSIVFLLCFFYVRCYKQINIISTQSLNQRILYFTLLFLLLWLFPIVDSIYASSGADSPDNIIVRLRYLSLAIMGGLGNGLLWYFAEKSFVSKGSMNVYDKSGKSLHVIKIRMVTVTK